MKDSGPPGRLRHVHATAGTLACPVRQKRLRPAPALPARAWRVVRTNAAPSRGPEDGRDGADSRALEIAAAGVSGKAETARPWLNSARRRASL